MWSFILKKLKDNGLGFVQRIISILDAKDKNNDDSFKLKVNKKGVLFLFVFVLLAKDR
jgi:hypothetical protein